MSKRIISKGSANSVRAVNKNILSTTKGYLLYYQEKQKVNRCFRVNHTTEAIEDELCTIVDHGSKVLDVIVEHPIYGIITVDLIIATRQDVYDFIEKVKMNKTIPLKELTNDLHLHAVEADCEEILNKIETILQEKNYLVKYYT